MTLQGWSRWIAAFTVALALSSVTPVHVDAGSSEPTSATLLQDQAGILARTERLAGVFRTGSDAKPVTGKDRSLEDPPSLLTVDFIDIELSSALSRRTETTRVYPLWQFRGSSGYPRGPPRV